MYRPFSNCFVSALAKSRAASRLVRTMAGDNRNLLQTWLDIKLVLHGVQLWCFTAIFPKLLGFLLKKCFFGQTAVTDM